MKDSTSDAQAIAITKRWIETVVIELSLCPFAQTEFAAGRVRFSVARFDVFDSFLTHLGQECELLDRDAGVETTLAIYPDAFADFDDFRLLIEAGEDWLVDNGYEGVYQLASFHPAYRFADAPADDPANYTNRSPYPMLHLLREDSVERALTHHPNPERIPERNVEHTRRLGSAALQALLHACFETADS